MGESLGPIVNSVWPACRVTKPNPSSVSEPKTGPVALISIDREVAGFVSLSFRTPLTMKWSPKSSMNASSCTASMKTGKPHAIGLRPPRGTGLRSAWTIGRGDRSCHAECENRRERM